MSRRIWVTSAVVLCLIVVCLPNEFFAKDQDFTPEEVIAEHVKSLGNVKALANVKSRTFVGTSSAHFYQGMFGTLAGQSMYVTQGPKMGIVMKFPDRDYPGEYFAFDGDEVTVGHISPGQKSPVAEFLFRYNGLFKEGLMGGVLSPGWPLLKIEEKQPQMKYGEAKVEGRKLHMIEYRPKNRLGDVKIKLYFDWDTFRHVRTEYNVRHRLDASVLSEDTYTQEAFILTGNQPESIYRLVEIFDDFKKIGGDEGIVLPESYQINYSVEGSGDAFVGEWKLKAATWGFNQALDDNLFRAQK